MDKMLCVLFPGIGYHCDKPLLYYTDKLAVSLGYETIKLKYSGFDSAEDAVLHAVDLSTEQLKGIDFASYSRIVFVGKSIGTVACLACREKLGIDAKAVLLTPLVQTFDYPAHGCIAFHGTSDPYAATADIESLCSENDVGLFRYENANHSLETGSITDDLNILSDVIVKLKASQIF